MWNSARFNSWPSPFSNIHKSSSKLKYVLFADDTTLSFSHKNEDTLILTLNNELDHVSKWLRNNKLLLNTNKTHMMIFTKRNIDTPKYKVYLNGSEISIVSNTKFLGIQIDNKLSWNDHVNYISKKVSRNVGVLNILNFLPKDILLSLYYTLIYPFIIYCIVIWAATYFTTEPYQEYTNCKKEQ